MENKIKGIRCCDFFTPDDREDLIDGIMKKRECYAMPYHPRETYEKMSTEDLRSIYQFL